MSSAGEKASCFRDGALLGNLIHVAKLAAREDNHDTANDALNVMKDIVEETDCLVPPLKEKVNNEIDALRSFLHQRNQEGVRQSIEALETDIAPPVSVKLPGGHQGRRIIAYQLMIDGKPVGKPVPRKEAAADFEAAMMLHEGSKVELEPVTTH